MMGPEGVMGMADGNTGVPSLHRHLGRLEIGLQGDPAGQAARQTSLILHSSYQAPL